MEHNFENINCRLKEIRSQREFLDNERRFLKRNYLFQNSLGRILGYGLNNEYKNKIFGIGLTEANLKKEYKNLREIYRNRFDGLSYDELNEIYYKSFSRMNDLNSRIKKVSRMKKKVSFNKKRRIDYLIEDVEIELERRDRAFQDLTNELEKDRGVNIEAMVLRDYAN